jgi:hypothetical protein
MKADHSASANHRVHTDPVLSADEDSILYRSMAIADNHQNHF